MRILNAEVERGYNLGFSDNRTFYIIGNDGGLLNAPVPVTRVKLMVGERIEIMVNFANDAVGSSLNLMAYNSGQSLGFPGGEPNTSGQFGSLLNNIDFPVLHINVTNPTTAAISALPTSLANNTYWTAANASVQRTIQITNGNPGGTPFNFDNTSFNLNVINKSVNLDAIEQWTVANNQVFGHTFHIHDVQFKIVARNGNANAVGAHESGWKDVMYVPRGESVSFVAKFEDYADPIFPFMYHCHFSNHEDDGMMGQFVVTSPTALQEQVPSFGFTLFPNPSSDRIHIQLQDESSRVFYATITDAIGRVRRMLPQPDLKTGIDLSGLSPGLYHLHLMDEKTKQYTSADFIKQ
jgi:bilirubin oxidase